MKWRRDGSMDGCSALETRIIPRWNDASQSTIRDWITVEVGGGGRGWEEPGGDCSTLEGESCVDWDPFDAIWMKRRRWWRNGDGNSIFKNQELLRKEEEEASDDIYFCCCCCCCCCLGWKMSSSADYRRNRRIPRPLRPTISSAGFLFVSTRRRRRRGRRRIPLGFVGYCHKIGFQSTAFRYSISRFNFADLGRIGVGQTTPAAIFWLWKSAFSPPQRFIRFVLC